MVHFYMEQSVVKNNILQIPINFNSKPATSTDLLKKYLVKPKEGKWRIAYKFGISIEFLEILEDDDDVQNIYSNAKLSN